MMRRGLGLLTVIAGAVWPVAGQNCPDSTSRALADSVLTERLAENDVAGLEEILPLMRAEATRAAYGPERVGGYMIALARQFHLQDSLLAWYELAQAAQPSCLQPRLHPAIARFFFGDTVGALRGLEDLTQSFPDSTVVWLAAAHFYYRGGDSARAEHFRQRAVALGASSWQLQRWFLRPE